MDIKQKITDLETYAASLEKDIEETKKELNLTKLTIRRLIRHNQKADEILNNSQLAIIEEPLSI